MKRPVIAGSATPRIKYREANWIENRPGPTQFRKFFNQKLKAFLKIWKKTFSNYLVYAAKEFPVEMGHVVS